MGIKINPMTLGAAVVCVAMAASAALAQEKASAPSMPLSQQARALVSGVLADEPDGATQRRRDPLWNGVLIGAAAGLTFGLVGAERCGNDFGCTGDTWQFALLGAAVGAGIGIGVDALFDRHGAGGQGAPPHTRVRLAPLLAGRTRGVRASMAF